MGNDRPDTAARSVRGVLFDMGGTLFDYGSRSLMGQANEAALRELGLDPEAPDVWEARRAASDAVSREYAARRSFLHGDFFRARVVRTAELLGVEATPEVLDRFAVDNVGNIIEHLPPKADAASTLRALRDRNLYLAIVSNADDSWLGPVVRRHGFDHLLDDWTSSEEADSCKPDPQIFVHALAKAGLDAVEVLFVGDSLQHDIAGAHAAGLRSVLIAANDEPAPLSAGLTSDVVPEHCIETLGDLVAIIDTLNAPQ